MQRNTRRWTNREEQILALVAAGHTNGEIAEQLDISFNTAKWHVSELISKAGVQSRYELADLWRAERGLARRLRRSFAPLALSMPAKVLGATALAGVATIGIAGMVLARGDNSFANPRETTEQVTTGPPQTPVVNANVPTTAGPRVPYLSAQDAITTAQRLADYLISRSGQTFLDVNGTPVAMANVPLTRLQQQHTTGLIEFSDGGRSTVAEADIWIAEWLGTGFSSSASPVNDGVLSVTIAFTDNHQPQIVAAGMGVTPASTYERLGEYIATAWPADGTILSASQTAWAPGHAPTGMCIVVTPEAASFRILLGNRDVTSEIRNFRAPFGFDNTRLYCFRPEAEIEPGTYEAKFEAFDATGTSAQVVERIIEITP